MCAAGTVESSTTNRGQILINGFDLLRKGLFCAVLFFWCCSFHFMKEIWVYVCTRNPSTNPLPPLSPPYQTPPCYPSSLDCMTSLPSSVSGLHATHHTAELRPTSDICAVCSQIFSTSGYLVGSQICGGWYFFGYLVDDIWSGPKYVEDILFMVLFILLCAALIVGDIWCALTLFGKEKE